jgi:hypothetical protein
MKNRWGLLFLIAGSLLLAACRGASSERLWLKAPDWGRAQLVGGMGIPDPAPLVVDGEGNIYFLFINDEPEMLRAQIVALDEEAELLWEHTFSEVLRLPDDPQLVWDGQMLHAFWVSDGALITTQLDRNGSVLQEPAVISGDLRVDSYRTAGSVTGGLAVWFATDRREPGLYLADVDLVEEPLLIDEEGVLPALSFDESGTLHALWAHYPRDNPQTAFLYAAYPDGSYRPDAASIVYETSIPQSADMVGPTLGLDANKVYVYWIEIFRTGLEAGFTQTRFFSFPYEAPQQITALQEIFIPAEHDLGYEPFPEESIQAGERYSLASRPSPNLTVLQDINTNPVQEEELVVAFRASVDYYWRRTASQIGLVYLQNGLPTSYQLLSFTQQPSTDPVVATDSDGRLYVTWLETGDVSRFDVFFAATAEGIQTAFNPVTTDDVTQLSAATTFGLLTGVLLAPIAAVLWMILPMLVVLLTSIFRRGEPTFRSPGTIITLVPAIAVFQVAKIASLPDITDYVPFSAWLPLPELLKAPLQIIVPLVIMLGAIFAAWHFTYRRKTDSPLYFMILYVAIDTLFTMAVYGVLFYGAF